MIKISLSGKIRIVLIAVMVLAVCAVIFIFSGYRQMLETAAPLVTALEDGSSMSISSVKQVATRDGITEWSLDAASASLVNGEKEAVFQKPSVIFYMKNQEKVRLTAEKGVVQTASNDIKVSGDVILQDSLYIIRTAALTYLHSERRFTSDVPVRITGSGFDLSADSASLDMKERKAVFRGNVKGVFSEGLSL